MDLGLTNKHALVLGASQGLGFAVAKAFLCEGATVTLSGRSPLVGFMTTLAGEVAKDGVTVNMLLPGRIATARTKSLDAAQAARSGRPVQDISAESAATIPAGRYGTVNEFGAVAAFLAGAPASYVTGSMRRVDGGTIRSV